MVNEVFKKLSDLICDTYLIADPSIIKVLAACVIAHRLVADPVWLVIVAGSSSGKSELLNAIDSVDGIHTLDSLTASTFASGQKKSGGINESSLLHRLKNGIMVIKDFSTIFALQQDTRGEIMSQLRKIYDGTYKKEFGTGETMDWKGKVGLIAGATTQIYMMQEQYAAMGERFLMYKYIDTQADTYNKYRLDMTRRAVDNMSSGSFKDKRSAICAAFKDFLDGHVKIPVVPPQMPEVLKEEIIVLANLATLARSKVERDWRSPQKTILFVQDPEMPARFASQLITIAAGLKIINGGRELKEEDMKILYKIALDSIPITRRLTLRELASYQEVETEALAVKLNFPTDTVHRWCADLNALKIIDRVKGHRSDRWRLKSEFKLLLNKFDGVVETQETLDSVKEEVGEEENIKADTFKLAAW